MTGPGEVPQARPPEPAESERWIAEVRDLREGGPTRRVTARARVRRVQVGRHRDDPLFAVEAGLGLFRFGIVMVAVDGLFGRWTRPRMEETHAEVALYAPGSGAGDLPAVVVDVPVAVAAAVEAQGGEVEVRGELAPGHGVVLVLDDGQVVACQYPAMPPPPVAARRIWGLQG